MAATSTFLALFEDIDPAANAIEHLHEMGIDDDHIDVISGIPFKEEILGRPKVWTNVPRLAMGGAMIGLIIGMFLIFGIPGLYPLHVGGQPLFPIPPFFIVGFEMTMLGLMGTTFIGLFLESRFPSYEPKEYVPEISDGKIAVLFSCQSAQQARIEKSLRSLGAEWIRPAEARKL
jgi:hypothetical protein